MHTARKGKSAVQVLFFSLFACLLFATHGCGGGGNNGGVVGGGGGGSSPNAGIYNATLTVNVSGTGVPSLSETATGTVRITDDGSVFLTIADDDGDLFGGQGALVGDSFSITDSDEVTVNGLTCSGSVTINGTVSGETISGPISGSLVCNGIPISISGNLQATRAPTASLHGTAARGGGGMVRAMAKYLAY